MISKVLAWILPKPPSRRSLSPVFDKNPDAVAAIRFERIANLSGDWTIIEWSAQPMLANSHVAYRRARESTFRKSERSCDISVFERLLADIERLDTPPITNFTRPVRDGTRDFISWGNRVDFRFVTFTLPIEGEARQSLSDLIMKSVLSQLKELRGEEIQRSDK